MGNHRPYRDESPKGRLAHARGSVDSLRYRTATVRESVLTQAVRRRLGRAPVPPAPFSLINPHNPSIGSPVQKGRSRRAHSGSAAPRSSHAGAVSECCVIRYPKSDRGEDSVWLTHTP